MLILLAIKVRRNRAFQTCLPLPKGLVVGICAIVEILQLMMEEYILSHVVVPQFYSSAEGHVLFV